MRGGSIHQDNVLWTGIIIVLVGCNIAVYANISHYQPGTDFVELAFGELPPRAVAAGELIPLQFTLTSRSDVARTVVYRVEAEDHMIERSVIIQPEEQRSITEWITITTRNATRISISMGEQEIHLWVNAP